MSDPLKKPTLLDALITASRVLTLYGGEKGLPIARRLDQEARRIATQMAREEERRRAIKHMQDMGYTKAEQRTYFKRRAKALKEYRDAARKSKKKEGVPS
jgi:hypothetical protein